MGLCFSTSRDASVVDNNSTMPVDFFTCCAHSTDLDSSGLMSLALELEQAPKFGTLHELNKSYFRKFHFEPFVCFSYF